MNDKALTKIVVDIVMTVLFIILIYPPNTGIALHEILGMGMGVLFIFHIMLNWSWCKNISKNLFNPKLKTKPRMFYVLNIILFIGFTIIIITGIEISQVLFASETAIMSKRLYILHKQVSYLCLVLFSVHIALHWSFVKKAMCKLLAVLKIPAAGKTVINIGAIVLMIGLLYSQINSITTMGADQIRTSASRPNSSYYHSKSGEDQDKYIAPDTDNAGDTVALTDYLKKMFCTGCHKRCPLLSVQCNTGLQQQEAAKIQYQIEYGDTILK